MRTTDLLVTGARPGGLRRGIRAPAARQEGDSSSARSSAAVERRVSVEDDHVSTVVDRRATPAMGIGSAPVSVDMAKMVV
jgi:hypothetical protein